MAEPAWIQEKRRDRAGRHARERRMAGRYQHTLAIIRPHHTWLAWCVGWIDGIVQYFPTVMRSRRASIAARTARAVLEGVPSPSHYTRGEAPRNNLLSAPQPYPRIRIRSRYIAHIVSALVVLAAVLVSGDISVGTGTSLLREAAANRSTQVEDEDLRVLRTLPSNAQMATDGEPMLPVLRNLSPEIAPMFVESHQVVEGETLGEIAARYRVSVASLFWANNLQGNGIFAAGVELRIPRVSGMVHVLQPDDTVELVAQRYNVTPEAIVRYLANGISADAPLPVGREIFIPSGTQSYPAEVLARYGGEQGIASMRAVVAGVTQESQINLRAGPGREYPRLGYLDAGRRLKLIARYSEWIKVENEGSETGWVRSDLLGLTDATVKALPETNDFPPPPPRWVWPTKGELTSSFGWRSQPYRSFHDGLDLANRAGTPIVAASAGRVIQAGWCGGFGYCVELDHGEGITTLYAHMLKQPPIASGDMVAAGDMVGWMGNTYDKSRGGFSTGVHLHFITKVNGKAVDPLKFLS